MIKYTIPQFPKFKKLELSDKNGIEKLTNKYPPYSDYNFVSLWNYNAKNDAKISILNNNLVLLYRDYITNEPFLSFTGSNKITNTSKTLISYAQKIKLTQELQLIPEHVILAQKKLLTKFIIKEDRDHFDYILSVSDYCALNGNAFSKHRKQIKRIYKCYPNIKLRIIDLQNTAIQKEIINLFHNWEIKKGEQREKTHRELYALQRTLKSTKYFKLLGIGAYNNQNLEGFLVADIENNIYATSHFLKTNLSIASLSIALHHYLAKELHKKGFLFINIQQDLGIKNLRLTKIQSRPIKYLKKYTISPK